MTEEQRVHMGQNVKDIAWHYYAGLKGISLTDAKKEFSERLFANDILVDTALRMATTEVFEVLR
ncbi:MAG: hypothetical protein ACYCR8_03295 [Cuniculiplasma sp.]